MNPRNFLWEILSKPIFFFILFLFERHLSGIFLSPNHHQSNIQWFCHIPTTLTKPSQGHTHTHTHIHTDSLKTQQRITPPHHKNSLCEQTAGENFFARKLLKRSLESRTFKWVKLKCSKRACEIEQKYESTTSDLWSEIMILQTLLGNDSK